MARETSSVDFGHTRIHYAIRRSSRRRTIAVSVDRWNGVLLTAPLGTPMRRLDHVVHEKARWIVERLRHVREGEDGLPAREFVSGESYLYLGRHYRLRVLRRAQTGEAHLDRGWLLVPVSRALEGRGRALAVRDRLEEWYRRHAAERLPERVARWLPRLSVPEPEIVVKDQLRRWGSCDRRGIIRVNWRIIQAPMRLVDYVVVHELVHLRHKNHTKEYWSLLGRVLPDYEKRREELRRIGPRLEW